jgi:hypothetical protein
MKVLITQSNYIPWKGYFDSISLCDIFVVYDDMQFTKRDWRNRNLIKTPQGLTWLSIPIEVKGKYFQKIKDTKIANKDWNLSHWNIIKQNYKNADYYKEMAEWIEPLYLNCNFEYLSEVNLHFIHAINQYLGINTKIVSSSDFELHDDRNQRLVEICKALNGTEYYSGPAAKNYLEIEKFADASITVHFFDYSGYSIYPQLHEGFEHGVSILDLLFNTGNNARKYLKYLNE